MIVVYIDSHLYPVQVVTVASHVLRVVDVLQGAGAVGLAVEHRTGTALHAGVVHDTGCMGHTLLGHDAMLQMRC